MKHWLDGMLGTLPPTTAQLAERVDELYRGLQYPAIVIGKLCAEADRWQAAIRAMRSPVNLPDILRARSAVGS